MAAGSSPNSDGSDPPNNDPNTSTQLISDDVQLDKALARVANIVVKAYFQFRENTYDNPIDRVEEKEGEIISYDSDVDFEFHPFPGHLVHRPATKKALLTAWMCNEPAAFMYHLLKKLLEGLDVTVEEAILFFRETRLKVTSVRASGGTESNTSNFSHELLVISSKKSNRQWAIDITGAQYGIFQTFWKWSDYQTRNFVLSHRITLNSFGTSKALLAGMATQSGAPDIVYGVVAEIASELDRVVDAWELQNMALSELIMLEDKTKYEQHQKALQVSMKRGVKEYIDTQDFTPRTKAAKRYIEGNRTRHHNKDLSELLGLFSKVHCL